MATQLVKFENSGIALPPVDMEGKSSTWIERVRTFRISDQATHDQAVEWLLSITDLKAEIVEHHRESKAKANEAHLAVCAAERKLLDPIERSEEILRKGIGDFILRMKGKQKELNRQARELSQATTVHAPAQRAYIPSESINTREAWKAEVYDIRALCRAIADGAVSPMYIEGKQNLLNDLANSERSLMSVPGVRAVPNASVAINRR
jgi:hypothetical protein